MSKYRHWAVLASVGGMVGACQLELDGRACGVASSDQTTGCEEGWSCCLDDICRRDCADGSEEPSPDGNGSGDADANEPGAPNGPGAGDPPGEEGPPPTSVQAEVGVEGGALVLGDASVQILPGALQEVTPLELSVLELPLALPRAHRPSSAVYSLSAPSLARPAAFDVLVDAESFNHLVVLELRNDHWQPVTAARYDAEPAAGADEPRQGHVSWTATRGGVFLVAIVDPYAAMEVVLGATSYAYDCERGGGSSLVNPGDNGGRGPLIDPYSNSFSFPECPWPHARSLTLDVLFRNFALSEGLTLGTWDLAAPESILPVRIEFTAEEGPDSPRVAYRQYDSTALIESAEGPIPYVTYQGYHQSPLASGSITVSRLPTVSNTGHSSEAEFFDRQASFYVIELSNVTLGATELVMANPDDPFPPTVSIPSATLTYVL